jgi:hypothetical protein
VNVDSSVNYLAVSPIARRRQPRPSLQTHCPEDRVIVTMKVTVKGLGASPLSCVVKRCACFPKGHSDAPLFTFLQIGTKIIAKNVALGFHGTPLDWLKGNRPRPFLQIL